jgi:hypothetical protein
VRGFVEALRNYTCLDFLQSRHPDASAWERLRWLPAIGLLAGSLVAWIHLPVAEFLLPPDAALMAALALQIFLLNFGPEQALWRGMAPRPESAGVATAALTLCVLAKFVVYRQFLTPETGRVLMLGTTAALTGPILIAASMRPGAVGGFVAAPSGALVAVLLTFWVAAAVLVAAASGGTPGHSLRTAVCVLASTALVQMIGAAWLRERHGGFPEPLLLMFSLPCEIAACAGLLMARTQFV